MNKTKRLFKMEVEKRLKQGLGLTENPIITENDLIHLPEPVRRYLIYTGVIGREKVVNARIVFEGEMKMDPQKGWFKIRSEQYNFFDNPARLFFIQSKMLGLPITGLDSYLNGRGNMLIELASLFTVADVKGREMDISSATTLLNDICLLIPAVLIDKRIRWEVLDFSKVKATFADRGLRVSAELSFNQKGELTNFTSEDRYYTSRDNTLKKTKWSTPILNYEEVNGRKLPVFAEGIWHFQDRDFCYARFKLKEVEYNCRQFK